MSSIREGILIGIGNPLLDIIVQTDTSLLKKYNLEPNNAIIAEESHIPLYGEIEKLFEPQYIAGGSAQNVLRVFQWLLGLKNASVYMGSVGKDNHSEILKSKAIENGVNVQYQYQDNVATGTCAVLVTHDNGHSHRSLCAYLGAANCFTQDHIMKPENMKLIQEASFIYIGGFFLTVSPETIMELAEISFKSDKILISNLNAQFICQFYTDRLMNLMPYLDVLCGNETEAAALAEALDFKVTDLKAIALKIAQLPKKNNNPRIVVITQGHLPVLLAHGSEIIEVEVPLISKDTIIDTNGAGDAFVGGFLSQFIPKRSLKDCVKCGIWAAGQIIQNSGCSFDPNLKYNP